MVKRTKRYAVVEGIHKGKDGKPESFSAEVDISSRDEKTVARVARKQLKQDVILTSIAFYELVAEMDNETFFKNATFGEPTLVDPDGEDSDEDLQ
jgi:hypothetical protein